MCIVCRQVTRLLFFSPFFFSPPDSVDIQNTPLCDSYSCGGDTTKQGCCNLCDLDVYDNLGMEIWKDWDSTSKSCCIPTFDTDVTYIDLRWTNIKEITVATFGGLTSLKQLDLHNNQNIEFVQMGSFDDLFNITEIGINAIDNVWTKGEPLAAATDACDRARAQGASLSNTALCSLVHTQPGETAYLIATGSASAVLTVALQCTHTGVFWESFFLGLAIFDVFSDFGVYAFVTQRPDFAKAIGRPENGTTTADQGLRMVPTDTGLWCLLIMRNISAEATRR